jgi:hypothetical protein
VHYDTQRYKSILDTYIPIVLVNPRYALNRLYLKNYLCACFHVCGFISSGVDVVAQQDKKILTTLK